MTAVPYEFVDERRNAPPVREWSSIRRDAAALRLSRDRTRLARILYTAGLDKVEIAEILGIDWAQVDYVLRGLL